MAIVLKNDALIQASDEKIRPRTLYDYEQIAQKVLEELKDSPLMDCLKDYSVNRPAESLELIFKVASWVIRDDYAREHPIKTLRYPLRKE